MRKREAEPEDVHRWIISYADFITLLFAFFVVLFSMANVNEKKYESFSELLTGIFERAPKGEEPIQIAEPKTSEVSPIDTELGNSELQGDTTVDAGASRFDFSNMISSTEQALEQNFQLDEPGMDYRLAVKEGRLEVTLNESFLFQVGSATISAEADVLLMALAKNLREMNAPIVVQGHTDDVPIQSALYASNWELSAARAAAIARYLTYGGVQPNQVFAMGFGEFYPIASNKDPLGRQLNRRVKLVIGDSSVTLKELIQ